MVKKLKKKLLKWEETTITRQVIFDYEYFSKHYKLVTIDLRKQMELENSDLK